MVQCQPERIRWHLSAVMSRLHQHLGIVCWVSGQVQTKDDVIVRRDGLHRWKYLSDDGCSTTHTTFYVVPGGCNSSVLKENFSHEYLSYLTGGKCFRFEMVVYDVGS